MRSKDITYERFINLTNKLGFFVAEEALEKFKNYHRLLLEFGAKINLYSKNDRNRLLVYHFIDSLLPLNLIPQNCLLGDLGSGAGFPGLVLKIMRPDLKVYLIEGRKKKAVFLSYAVKALGLSDITVSDKRIEEMVEPKFNLLTIRLFGDIKDTLPLIAHLLKEDSRIIFYKGGDYERELSEGEKVMKRYNITLEAIHTFHLSWIRLTRRILVLGKCR